MSIKRLLQYVLYCVLANTPAMHAFSQTYHTQLDNGLKVILKPDHRAPIAIIMLWYHIGSADEIGGHTGLAHALEHMMFKGTKEISAGMFSKMIAAAGGQENAFTNQDYTAYFEKINIHSLELAIKLEADRMRNLELKKDEFSKEIKVIQEERRMRVEDEPASLALERLMATAYLTPAYQHPVIGWMSDLKNMSIHTLRDWYQNYYTPNNATLVIVGDINQENVLDLIKRYFASIPAHQDVVRPIQEAPPALGKKENEVHIVAQQPLLLLSYTVPSLGYANFKKIKQTQQSKEAEMLTKDAYTLEVIAGILDAGDNGRLTTQLIKNQHIVAQANAYYDLYTRMQTQFIFSAVPVPQKSLNNIQKSIENEIYKLQTQLVDKKELDRIKTQLIAQYTFSQDSLFAQAMQLGLLDSVGLSEITFHDYPKAIASITPEQIRTCAQKYFCSNCLTKTRLIPSAESTHE